jgi:hypothetical protein
MLTKLERRRRGQRGSVLSALLIIIAFLSILGSALMSEISSQFLMTRNLVDQVTAQATVQSGMENAIAQLQARVVPFRCSTDQPNPIVLPTAVNNQWAAANQITCRSIVPDVARGLAAGGFTVDGTHVAIGAHRIYLVGDQNGNVYSYQFGQTAQIWNRSVNVGHALTAPPAEMAYGGHFLAAVPNGASVTFVNDFGSSASGGCSVSTSSTVRARPGFGAGTSFGTYTFFGDDSGRLYVSDPNCQAQAPPSAPLGGSVVGSLLVLPGTVTTNQNSGACPGGNFGEGNNEKITTTTVDVMALISSGSSSTLVDVAYAEDSAGSNTQTCWVTNNSRTLSFGSATGLSFFASGSTRLAAVGFAGGQLQLATITAFSAHGNASGFTYTLTRGQSVALGGSMSRAPSWSTNGSSVGAADGQSLFVFDSGLKQLFRYDGTAAINTSPAADIRGDWYFGADDGYVYDLEPPATGTAMFKAARFGPGGQIRSSPIVGSPSDGCSGNLCMYFGGASSGTYFVQIGNIRVMELRSCITSGTSSTSCVSASANNPSLWARLEVGDPTYMQGRSVNVIGWAYSNGP